MGFLNDLQRIIVLQSHLCQNGFHIAARFGKATVLQKYMKVFPRGIFLYTEGTVQDVFGVVLDFDFVVQKVYING